MVGVYGRGPPKPTARFKWPWTSTPSGIGTAAGKRRDECGSRLAGSHSMELERGSAIWNSKFVCKFPYIYFPHFGQTAPPAKNDKATSFFPVAVVVCASFRFRALRFIAPLRCHLLHFLDYSINKIGTETLLQSYSFCKNFLPQPIYKSINISYIYTMFQKPFMSFLKNSIKLRVLNLFRSPHFA